MDHKARRQKRQDDVLSSLNVTIEALNLAKELSGVMPAKAVFGIVCVILTMIRVSFLMVYMDLCKLKFVCRIRLSTKEITSNSGWPAPTFVPLSTED